jgi:hypothetical protein
MTYKPVSATWSSGEGESLVFGSCPLKSWESINIDIKYGSQYQMEKIINKINRTLYNYGLSTLSQSS